MKVLSQQWKTERVIDCEVSTDVYNMSNTSWLWGTLSVDVVCVCLSVCLCVHVQAEHTVELLSRELQSKRLVCDRTERMCDWLFLSLAY